MCAAGNDVLYNRTAFIARLMLGLCHLNAVTVAVGESTLRWAVYQHPLFDIYRPMISTHSVMGLTRLWAKAFIQRYNASYKIVKPGSQIMLYCLVRKRWHGKFKLAAGFLFSFLFSTQRIENSRKWILFGQVVESACRNGQHFLNLWWIWNILTKNFWSFSGLH